MNEEIVSHVYYKRMNAKLLCLFCWLYYIKQLATLYIHGRKRELSENYIFVYH